MKTIIEMNGMEAILTITLVYLLGTIASTIYSLFKSRYAKKHWMDLS